MKRNAGLTGTILLLLPLVLQFNTLAWSQHKIALQPFTGFDAKLIPKVTAGLNEVFRNIEIEVRPTIELPESAFYEPRKRYRAEKLLYYLRSFYSYKVKKRYSKILGLTGKDISAAKGKYYDWGIIGYAFLNNGPCVVSTFRLKKGMKSQRHFEERLIKAVVHELGHTFGLPHCETRGCVMQDAKGTVKTIDTSDGRFCPKCKKQVYMIIK